MNLIRYCIDNPVKVAVAVLLTVLFGVVSLTVIAVQLVPNVDQPIVTVTTTWVGRSPDEVEREIVEEQEDVLKNVKNLRKMTAEATVGRSEITLEFFIGTDLDAARQEVSDSLRQVSEYPEDVDEPVIATGESGSGDPIAWLIVNCEDPGFDVQTLGDLAENRVKPYLERIPGVSQVRVYGGREREVHIEVRPETLAQRGITFNAFVRALQSENVNVSAGDLAQGRLDVRVRTVGQYDDLDQVRETVIAYDATGGPVRVRDVGEVKSGFARRRSFVRSRGQLALAIPVFRESGANVIKIVEGTNRYEGLRKRVEHINEPGGVLEQLARQAMSEQGLASPPKLKLEMVYNETGYIYSALGLVQSNLFIGGALAGLVLLVFLRSIRPTLIVALAIPVSVVGTFVAMVAFGRNINVISLAGLAFAVGMVVDNAIVVLENIDRHLHMGKSPVRAAYDGTAEVWSAILASTLTTLAVFLPVLTIQEEAGQLFRDITLAICTSVALSLVVAVTVIPTAAARFMKRVDRPEGALLKAAHNLFGLGSLFAALGRSIAGFVHWATQPTALGVGVRSATVAGFTVISVVASMLLMPPTDYLPRGNQNIVFGGMLSPPGYNIEQDRSIAERVEMTMRPWWEARTYADVAKLPPVYDPFAMMFAGLMVQVPDIPPVENYFFVSFNGSLFGGATSRDPENVRPLGSLLTAAWNTVPGSIGFAEQASLFGRGLAGSRQIDVEVVGDDLDQVRQAAGALRGRMIEMYGFPKVRPNPSNFDLPLPETQVVIDQVTAKDLGIDVASMGLGVRALVDGITIGDYRLSGDTIDIVAKRPGDDVLTADRLKEVPLAYVTQSGQIGTVPLGSVARVVDTTAAQSILRIEERRAVSLAVVPPDDTPLEQAMNDINRVIAELKAAGAIPRDVEANLSGSADKLTDVREAMLGSWQGWTLDTLLSLGLSRMFLALLVTYLLMAALFESWLHPLVVMFTVPLATVGGFMGLRIMHTFNPDQQLDTLTMLGFVILIGVVVNNAILLVYQALNFMKGFGESEKDVIEKMPPRKAIAESVRTRLRPILMTTLTSVAGMLPLVVAPGSGSELYKGLGSVMVGGLCVATLFTLLVIPFLFSLVLDAKIAVYRRLGWPVKELGEVERLG